MKISFQVKISLRRETRPFWPHYGQFRGSTTNELGVDGGQALERLTSSFQLLGHLTVDGTEPRLSQRLATYWLPGGKRLKGQMPVTL